MRWLLHIVGVVISAALVFLYAASQSHPPVPGGEPLSDAQQRIELAAEARFELLFRTPLTFVGLDPFNGFNEWLLVAFYGLGIWLLCQFVFQSCFRLALRASSNTTKSFSESRRSEA